MTRLPVLFALATSVLAAGCAHSTVRWRGAGPPAVAASGPILVSVLPGPALPPESAGFDAQLLQVVREHNPEAKLARGNENDANFLLTATILRWRDAQTQYSGEPDQVSIAVRLTRLRPSELVGEFQFDARSAPFAVRDAPADRLVNERFREAVRRLLAPAGH